MKKEQNSQEPQSIKLGIPNVIGSAYGIQYRDLKTEFLAIQNDFVGKPLTIVIMEEINSRYQNLFNHFGLRDLQWRLIRGENSVVFTPIRAIDQYAINGILSL
jgi:hypothetical protein